MFKVCKAFKVYRGTQELKDRQDLKEQLARKVPQEHKVQLDHKVQQAAQERKALLVLEPKVYGDERGFFYECFNQRDFRNVIGREVTFVQDNHSRSQRGVLRGMHFQNPGPQGKLVRVVRGAVFELLREGQRVESAIEESQKGPRAGDVRLIEG